MEHHEHTHYWFSVHLGMEKVPTWYKRKKEWIHEIATLFSLRQTCHYTGLDNSAYYCFRYEISKRFRASYSAIDHCIGVCATDPSNPMGVLWDYFAQAEPRLTRTK